jgi:hypothetical protein
MSITRQYELPLAGTSISLPCFFPSISSVKANLLTVHYLELIDAIAHPLFLISAYDVFHAGKEHQQRMAAVVRRAKDRNAVVFLDSGNYEGFWKGDRGWTVDRFHTVCQAYDHHLCFCFDNQAPPNTWEAISEDVIASVLRDQEKARGTVIPIVHGPCQLLPRAAQRVADKLCPVLLAVPERALGDGIAKRARTVREMRNALDALGFYCPLHLLGTGNPLSILVYTLAGADSFDGLEWCQTAVDHGTGLLYHFHQWDFLAGQTEWGSSADLPYIQSVLLHNLSFYRDFMRTLHSALIDGAAEGLLKAYLRCEHAKTVLSVLTGNE